MVSAVLALGLWAALPAATGAEHVSTETVRSVSAAEAVEWALGGNVEYRSAALAVDQAQGAERQARGRFDPSLQLNLGFSHQRGELLPATRRQQEGNRRLFATVDRELSRVADDLERQLQQSPGVLAVQCAPGNQLVINGRDLCEDPFITAQRRRFDELLTRLIGRAEDEESALNLQSIQNQLRQSNRQFIEETIVALRRAALGNRRALADLGPIPEIEREVTLTLDAAWFMPLQNGMTLKPQILLETKDDNFEDKPLSQRFGGKGLKRTTRGAIGLTWTAPLGRGGRIGTTATLEAQEIRTQAALESARFAAQKAAFAALEAYWALAAAEARVRLAKTQVEARDALLAVARALVSADQAAPAELGELRAQWAQAQADLLVREQERADRAEALRLLLGALGFDPVRLETRTALPRVDRPEPACRPELEVMLQQALRGRGDLAALALTEEAAARLSTGARDALRPRWEVSLTVGMAGREEDQSLTRGYQGALLGNLIGPTVFLTVSGELDPNNQRAEGALGRSLAIENQASIRYAEAERELRRELIGVLQRWVEAQRELYLRQQAAATYRALLEDARAAFRLGEQSAADTLTTELQAAAAEDLLIDAQLHFATLRAELGFRSGALIEGAEPFRLRPGAELDPWPCTPGASGAHPSDLPPIESRRGDRHG